MFKNKIFLLKEKIKNISNGNSKRKIENLVIFIILLIITVIAINTIWGGEGNEVVNEEKKNPYVELAENQSPNIYSNNTNTDEYNLEEKLENILTKISGVGKVDVLITYSESNQIVAMYNEKQTATSTEETDNNGGIRKIEETDSNKEIVYEEKNGEKTPITQKVIMPKIEGAIITAEGAGNINIKTNIIEAVSAATGLATYRIQVFEMSN